MQRDGLASPAEAANGPPPSSLLVVEDMPIHRSVIERIGKQLGFVTQGAASVEGAVQQLRERDFECITLDLGLGEQAGVDLLRVLADRACRTPVIIVSAADEPVLNEVCRIGQTLDLNLWKPLHKPIDLRQLRSMLEQIRLCSGMYRLAHP